MKVWRIDLVMRSLSLSAPEASELSRTIGLILSIPFYPPINTSHVIIDLSSNSLFYLFLDLLFFPHSVLLNQFHQRFDSIIVGDVLADNLLAVIQVYLTRQGSNVSKISIGHLSRSVHDATHNSHGHSWQMARCFRDLSSGLLQVKECSSTGWTRYELRLGVAHTASLKKRESSVTEELNAEVCLSNLLNQDSISISIGKQGPYFGSKLQSEIVRVSNR
mmetsp:Transcript_8434/g.18946  ORF Transcript_8434/g.18946 Transcript_8434/m.18946 type:complete len:219 (+) Transcript_8434:240-896(+)